MEVSSKFITGVSPKLNKCELMLSLILLDLCKQPECKVGKALVYKHPLMTSTLKDNLTAISNKMSGRKIMCDSYYDKAEERYVLFEEIKREGVAFKIKFNKDVFNDLNKGEMIYIDCNLFKTFTAISEIRFVLWLKTWAVTDVERTVYFAPFKEYLNKTKIGCTFMRNHLQPIIAKCNKFGINVTAERVSDENDKRFIKAVLFKKQ